MTLVVAAFGPQAARTAEQALASVPAPERTTASIEAITLGWAGGSPFLQISDQNDVLVVLDGFLHNAPVKDQAGWLRDRYCNGGIEGLLEGILGDFVCVVLDRADERLFVARDALGVRPWYRARSHGTWVGGTNAAAVALVDGVNRQLHVPTAARLLAGMRVSTGPTLFSGVSTLRPGHAHDVRVDREWAYRNFAVRIDRETSWADAVDRAREVFETAVLGRVDPRFSPTAEISGGLDSSAVVGALATNAVPSLAVGRLLYDDPVADERKYSDAVAEHWALELVSVPAFRPDLDALAGLTRATGLPMGDINGVMALSLHQALVERGRPYMFTGVGGDDAFAAAPVGPRALSAISRRDTAALRQILKAPPLAPGPIWSQLVRPVAVEVLGRRRRSVPWLAPDVVREVGIVDELRARPASASGDRAIDWRWSNVNGGYLTSVLERTSAVAEHHGGRLTHPYLDPRLIESVYALDPAFALRAGGRGLQREALGGYLPPTVRERRSKAEFSALVWSVLLDEATQALLRDGRLLREPWVDAVQLLDLLERGAHRRPGTMYPLMGWLGAELRLAVFA